MSPLENDQHTVGGRNSAPVDRYSLSHYLQGLIYLSWCRISSIHSISRLVRHSRKEQSLCHVHPLYTCSSLTKVVGFLKAGNGANGCKRPTLSFALGRRPRAFPKFELFGAARFCEDDVGITRFFDPTKGCSPEYLKLKVVTKKRWLRHIAAGQPLLLKFGPAYNNGRIQRYRIAETFRRCIGCGHGEQLSISDGHFPY